jgi:hypothetical protein
MDENQDPESGINIPNPQHCRKVGFDLRSEKIIPDSVADPGSGAFLTPGSRIQEVSIRIRDEKPGSYFLELRNHFFGLKYLNSLMRIRDPGWRQFGSGIRDPGWKKSDPGSGIQIRYGTRKERGSNQIQNTISTSRC